MHGGMAGGAVLVARCTQVVGGGWLRAKGIGRQGAVAFQAELAHIGAQQLAGIGGAVGLMAAHAIACEAADMGKHEGAARVGMAALAGFLNRAQLKTLFTASAVGVVAIAARHGAVLQIVGKGFVQLGLKVLVAGEAEIGLFSRQQGEFGAMFGIVNRVAIRAGNAGCGVHIPARLSLVQVAGMTAIAGFHGFQTQTVADVAHIWVVQVFSCDAVTTDAVHLHLPGMHRQVQHIVHILMAIQTFLAGGHGVFGFFLVILSHGGAQAPNRKEQHRDSKYAHGTCFPGEFTISSPQTQSFF